jgi:type IV secretory pathway VirB3-like protein
LQEGEEKGIPPERGGIEGGKIKSPFVGYHRKGFLYSVIVLVVHAVFACYSFACRNLFHLSLSRKLTTESKYNIPELRFVRNEKRGYFHI